MSADYSGRHKTDSPGEPLYLYEEHPRGAQKRLELYSSHIGYLGKDTQGRGYRSTVRLGDLQPEIKHSQSLNWGVATFFLVLYFGRSHDIGGNPVMLPNAMNYLYISIHIIFASVVGLLTNKRRLPCLQFLNHSGKQAVLIGAFDDEKALSAGMGFGQAVCDQMKRLQGSSIGHD